MFSLTRRHTTTILQRDQIIHGDRTAGLVPRLVEAALMHEGRLTIDTNDVLDIAMRDDLVVVSAEARHVDMTKEPIIYESMRLAMAEQLNFGHLLDMSMRLCSNNHREDLNNR